MMIPSTIPAHADNNASLLEKLLISPSMGASVEDDCEEMMKG